MKKQITKNFYAFMMVAIMLSAYANAQIVYSDIIPDSTSTGSYSLDLNNDGISDFLIAHTTAPACVSHINNSINISPQNGSKCSVQKLAVGVVISSSLSYSAAGNQSMAQSFWTFGRCLHYSLGPWISGGNGYLALQLVVSGNTYYGWARLSTSGASSFTIQDYAYNSIPNQPILAGETSCTIPTVTITAGGSLSFCAGDSVTLTANGTGYQYQWKKGGVNISGAKSQTYVAKTAGVYKCKVTNSCGSKTSGGKTVSVPCKDASFLSMTNATELEHLSVYPNPATHTVTVKIPSDEEGEISIVNLYGEIVFSQKVNSEEEQIDVSKFSQGMYLVRWNSGENFQTKKFSVQK